MNRDGKAAVDAIASELTRWCDMSGVRGKDRDEALAIAQELTAHTARCATLTDAIGACDAISVKLLLTWHVVDPIANGPLSMDEGYGNVSITITYRADIGAVVTRTYVPQYNVIDQNAGFVHGERRVKVCALRDGSIVDTRAVRKSRAKGKVKTS